MSTTARKNSTPGVASLAMASAMASFFALLEVLKDVRDAQWSGYGAHEAVGMAAGWGLYLLALLLLTGVAAWLIRFPGADCRVALGGLLAGAAVWATLSPYREFFPTVDDALVAAGLTGIAIAAPLLARILHISFAAACGAMTTALLTGIAVCIVTAHLHWFDAGRVEAATQYGLVATLCAGTGFLAFTWILRRRTPWLRTVLALCIIAAPFAWLLPAGPPQDGAARNRLVIVVDTLRADALAPFGGPVAVPHIAALAEEGTLFEQCHSAAPWTPPSMTSLFSGHYPPGLNPDTPPAAWLDQLWRYEVTDVALNPATQYAEKGYATGAFVANALVPQFPNLMTPFAAQAFYHPMILRPAGMFARFPFLRDMLASVMPALAPTRPQDTTAALTRTARWFLRCHRDTPFFLYVHYMDPHAPYDPPERLRDGAHGPWPFFYPYPGGEPWGVPMVTLDFTLPPAEQDYVRRLYNAEVRYVDEAVGQLLTTLDGLGLRERTGIVFTADHGEEFWEHGHWGHGQSLYQELIHVPLIVANGTPPRRIATPVSLIDATGLLGLEPKPEWRGPGELAAAVTDGAEITPRPLFAQATSNKANPPQQMVRDGAWKLIRNAHGGNPRLYNLDDDPSEQTNLADAHPERVATLNTLLDEWQATFPNVFPGTAEDAPGQRNEMLEKLEALGYLQ